MLVFVCLFLGFFPDWEKLSKFSLNGRNPVSRFAEQRRFDANHSSLIDSNFCTKVGAGSWCIRHNDTDQEQ